MKKINQNILNIDSGLYDLMGGLIGKVLLVETTGLNCENLSTMIEKSFIYKYQMKGNTFSSGAAGINWVYTRLYTKKIIDKDTYNYLCQDDNELMDSSIEYLKSNNYDFLHGALGISWYILSKYKEIEHKEYFNKVIHMLKKNIEYLQIGEKKQDEEIEVNIGLSHGITSILQFCNETYKRNIYKSESLDIIRKISKFLLKNINKNINISYFPYSICKNKTKDSRLAWCYGDLGIGFVLHQTSIITKDRKLKHISLNILKRCSKRRKVSETNITDAGLCHGTAGALHIFNKLYSKTKIKSFKIARNYWLDETLKLCLYNDDDTISFEQHNIKTNTRHVNNSLLEGSIGVSLSLYSYVSKNFSWDYCLMLN